MPKYQFIDSDQLPTLLDKLNDLPNHRVIGFTSAPAVNNAMVYTVMVELVTMGRPKKGDKDGQ